MPNFLGSPINATGNYTTETIFSQWRWGTIEIALDIPLSIEVFFLSGCRFQETHGCRLGGLRERTPWHTLEKRRGYSRTARVSHRHAHARARKRNAARVEVLRGGHVHIRARKRTTQPSYSIGRAALWHPVTALGPHSGIWNAAVLRWTGENPPHMGMLWGNGVAIRRTGSIAWKGNAMAETFDVVFKRATGNEPFPYQRRLAQGETMPALLDVPTGAGKTAAAVLGWLWRRRYADAETRVATPRRLVYCLPMRVLVEQTADECRKWLGNLGILDNEDGSTPEGISVHILMGGNRDNDWDLYPERDAILIGTQDMLLSRALNRGYAASRYRWPRQFGLLNSDCFWVFDEIQLMGNGLATGVQLDGFRSSLWRTDPPCTTCWMSATSSTDPFRTTDRRELGVPEPEPLVLNDDDCQHQNLALRLNAEKNVKMLPKQPSPRNASRNGVLDLHQAGRLTLIVVNTVKSAQRWQKNLQDSLTAMQNDRKRVHYSCPEGPVLLHSRFRACDREREMKRLDEFLARVDKKSGAANGHPGLILVATQVVEAGVDISAANLWSELATWPSVIQRLGRLNREGKQTNATAYFWKPKDEENSAGSPNKGRTGPYAKAALKQSEELIANIVEGQNENRA